jgi:hypothetical protein
MAVYQGARRRAPLPLGLDGLAAGRRAAPAQPRASSRGVGRGRTNAAARKIAVRRPPTVGIALAAIVIVFIAAFMSLSQSVRVAATGYDIVRLASEHERLTAIRQDLASDVERLRGEPAIRKQALDAGLGQLGAPLLIPAR